MNRETQFLGFADLLIPEIDEAYGAVLEWAEQHEDASEKEIAQEIGSRYAAVIARRAYDLVKSACEDISMEQSDGQLSVEGMLAVITDLKEWPEENR